MMDTDPVVDVEQLRADAAARAAGRPVVDFDGDVTDEVVASVDIRRYRPRDAAADAPPIVFLHGGYGLFGDLSLQDGYCRRLASAVGRETIAIDYPLTPEHSFDESITAVLAVVHQLGPGPVVLSGDSAGGAVAVAAAKRLGAIATTLVLSNPNLDFTLKSFDPAQSAGPDADLSRFAFTTWHRVAGLEQAHWRSATSARDADAD